MKKYKSVPAPSLLYAAKNGLDSKIRDYARLINKEGDDGWKFVSMGTIQTSTPSGCLGGLLGQRPTLINHNMLIFEKEEISE